MGAALEKLGEAACERIAHELLTMTNKRSGTRLGALCPWHEEKTPGGFWYDFSRDQAVCYSCGGYGDIIDVFCQLRGIPAGAPESFKAFFAHFASNLKLEKRGGGERNTKKKTQWRPRTEVRGADNETWAEKAEAWVRDCAARLTDEDYTRLEAWGINADTAAKRSIGRQARDTFIPFTAWGLPYAVNENGRERHIHLPRGLVFPVYDMWKNLLRIKVRLDAPRDNEPRYKAITGGDRSCYAIFGALDSLVWFVTETERDGMLLCQELESYGIGGMATGSASMPPDAAADALLSSASLVVNALDNDAAGAAASWGFDPSAGNFRWNTAYPHCIRWLVPSKLGKDVGDLPGKLPVVEWALAALPPHMLRRCLARHKAWEEHGPESRNENFPNL